MPPKVVSVVGYFHSSISKGIYGTNKKVLSFYLDIKMAYLLFMQPIYLNN